MYYILNYKELLSYDDLFRVVASGNSAPNTISVGLFWKILCILSKKEKHFSISKFLHKNTCQFYQLNEYKWIQKWLFETALKMKRNDTSFEEKNNLKVQNLLWNKANLINPKSSYLLFSFYSAYDDSFWKEIKRHSSCRS